MARPLKHTPRTDLTQCTIRMPAGMWEGLDQLAAHFESNRSEMVRMAVEQLLRREHLWDDERMVSDRTAYLTKRYSRRES